MNKKNILIIRFSALGDLVTFEPMFRLIRESFKDANIIFLTSKLGESLYKDINYFDRLIVCKGVVDQIKALKENKFEIIFNLQCTKKSHYVTLFLNKKILINRDSNLFQKIFGFKRRAKSFETMLLEAGVSQEKIKEYHNKNLFTIKMPAEKIELFENGKIVAISTGSSKRWLSKRWGVESYNRLVEMLVEKGYNIVLVGDELTIEDGEFIESQNSSYIKNFINKTELSELKNILKSVDLFVGNDSGPAHIAASVGTNTVTIFGSTSVKHCVKNFMYIGEHISIAPKNLECCPCYRSSCPKSGNEHMKCMKSIGVENIFSEIVKILG